MRCGLLLLLTLAATSPLQPCDADEAPARPVPAAQKKAVPIQLRVFPPRQGPQETVDSRRQDPAAGLVLADRTLNVRLARAREALAAQRFPDTIQALQSLLDSQEDGAFYIDSERRSGLRSIKLEAERLLGTMPPAGRKVYEFQFGSQAQQMLEAAMEDGNVVGLAEISRRHFHTRAGFEATYLLGALHLDHGQPLAAALCFERLRRNSADRHRRHSMLCLKSAIAWSIAGMPQPAQACLIELKQSDPGFTFVRAGRTVKLFDDEEQAADWLKSLTGSLGKRPPQAAVEWPMLRGDASRTASSTGHGPILDAVWTASTSSWSVSADDAPFFGGVVNVALQIEELAGDFQKRNQAAIPGPNPLIVENVVLARTVDRLQAFDLASGDLLWETRGDTALEQLRNGTVPPLPGDRGSLLDPLLLQRVFTDSTYGSLSADGGIVFCIEGLGYSSALTGNMFGLARNQPPHPLATKKHNRLAAYSIRSGKLIWQKGGPAGGSTLGLAGHFFLGPPLPLAYKAYCLAEIAGQIRLAVLDSGTGEADWSQPLHSVPTSIIENERRARSGLSPSYADGVMICPTGAGIVVALDVATRRLMWAYRYREPEDDNPRNRMRALAIARMAAGRRGRGNPSGISKPPGHWLDSLAAIIDGRVILTPCDSDELHCVNLMDGSLVWKKPRNNRLFLGGVYDGKLLLVGNEQVELLRIDNGGAVWPEPTKFPLLSGRGVLTGNRYHVPLSTAAFATIDLDNGRIIASQKSAGGIVPGNLVCSGGHVIAQGTASLVCFRQKKPPAVQTSSE
jgi:outer membrane protein assembly factor BamB